MTLQRQNRNRLTDTEKQTYDYQRGKGGRGYKLGVERGLAETSYLYRIDKQQGFHVV